MPPPEKLLSDLEIKQYEQYGKLVVDEIKAEQSVRTFDNNQAGDPHWDKDF